MIRSIAGMRPMGTGKPRISTAVQLVDRVLQVELALGPVLAGLELVIGLAVVPELEAAPVAALELVIGLAVVPEPETALVVALELVISPAAVPAVVVVEAADGDKHSMRKNK